MGFFTCALWGEAVLSRHGAAAPSRPTANRTSEVATHARLCQLCLDNTHFIETQMTSMAIDPDGGLVGRYLWICQGLWSSVMRV